MATKKTVKATKLATLNAKALRIWTKCKRGGRATASERGAMLLAYWNNVLPRDANYSVSQWVEDGCPAI